jgi:hypothetical protein
MRSMVEGDRGKSIAQSHTPSTTLRAVPLPVPGRLTRPGCGHNGPAAKVPPKPEMVTGAVKREAGRNPALCPQL